jgi:DNA-binding LacI/PurR family transcriptional regulator
VNDAARKAGHRSGTPLTVYFSDDQMERLNRISTQRKVPKSELLRLAVDLLLERINNGQMELGIELRRM